MNPAKYDDTAEELTTLTLDQAIARSHALVDQVLADNPGITGTCVLFSGGNDSTVLTHLMQGRVNYVVHINTGIGVEETRTFVRDTCQQFGLPLLEEHPPAGATYDELVLRYGFPGPGGHMMMYTRLKERGLRKVRAQFVTNPRVDRVLFLAGMRTFESQRRMRNTEATRREGSTIWCSPIGHWTNAHMAEYRRLHEVPRNEVSDHLHMSGECLCGAFAKPGELDWIAMWYPATAARIRALEVKAEAAGVHCVWGTRPPRGRTKASADVNDLCAKCVEVAA